MTVSTGQAQAAYTGGVGNPRPPTLTTQSVNTAMAPNQNIPSASYNLATQLNAPNQTRIDDQSRNLITRGGLQQDAYGLGQDSLNAGYGFDSRMLANKQAGVGLDRQSNALDQALLGKQAGFNNDEYNLTMQALMSQYQTGRRKQLDDATARGAMVTTGNRADLNDLLTGRKQGEGKAKLGLESRAAQIDTAFQKGGLADKQLQLLSAKYGIEGEQLKSALSLGLRKLGLENQLSVQQLLEAGQDNIFAQGGLSAQITQEALRLGQQAANTPGGGAMLGQATIDLARRNAPTQDQLRQPGGGL